MICNSFDFPIWSLVYAAVAHIIYDLLNCIWFLFCFIRLLGVIGFIYCYYVIMIFYYAIGFYQALLGFIIAMLLGFIMIH